MKTLEILNLSSFNVEINDELKGVTTRVVTLKNVKFMKFNLHPSAPPDIDFTADYFDPVLEHDEHIGVEGTMSINLDGMQGIVKLTPESWKKIEEGKFWNGST